MSNYIEETYKFVQTQVAAVYSTSNVTLSVSSVNTSTSKSDPDSVINDTLRDLLRLGSCLSSPEVSTSTYISLTSHPLFVRELQT